MSSGDAVGRSTPGGPRPDRGSIVVVGGYGAVGRGVALSLAPVFPGQVIVAGRDLDRARALAARAPRGTLGWQRVDVDSPTDVALLLRDAAVAVMCVERGNVEFARACLERGVHYVDISATAAVLDGIADLDPVAVGHGATAVLSVGLAPGLTNLLARHCVARLPTATSVDLTVFLGTAGDHGPDSLRWTLEQLGARATHRPARAYLPGVGRRTAYAFPFSDQDTLTGSLGIPVVTRLCFDSVALTTGVFALRRLGFFALTRRWGANRRLATALRHLPFGTDRFAVTASADDPSGRRVSAAATGREEARATAMVAALVAQRLNRQQLTPGVSHIDELFSVDDFLRELPAQGIRIYSDDVIMDTGTEG